MSILIKEFKELCERKVSKDNSAFPVSKISKIKNHKLGVNESNLPVFFIRCENSKEKKDVDSNLELIQVDYNRKCALVNEKNKNIEGLYTIISLKSNSLDIQQYFLDVIYLMLCNLPVKLQMKELKAEIAKVVNLFSRFSQPPLKTIQGLWAELLVIEQSSNPVYLIESWHFNPTDKYDFNDGVDKIEVKSTTKNKRIHAFSIEQLNPNSNSRLLIASVFVVQTGIGKSVFNLSENIEKRLKNTNVHFKLKEIIASTLGDNFEKAQEVFYDYQYSIDNLSFFRSTDIPNIDLNLISFEISNIHFDCDISKVVPIKKVSLNSKLHKALL